MARRRSFYPDRTACFGQPACNRTGHSLRRPTLSRAAARADQHRNQRFADRCGSTGRGIEDATLKPAARDSAYSNWNKNRPTLRVLVRRHLIFLEPDGEDKEKPPETYSG